MIDEAERQYQQKQQLNLVTNDDASVQIRPQTQTQTQSEPKPNPLLNLIGESSFDEDEDISTDKDQRHNIHSSQANKKLDLYFSEGLIEIDTTRKNCVTQYDVLGFWRNQKDRFQLLSPIARKWLGAVATSVPSERCFSVSGGTVTKKRNKLSSDHVDDLVFLHDNLRKLD